MRTIAGHTVVLDGMTVHVTRVPLTNGHTQLSVFINTEGMRTDHTEDGTPQIQVVLNDATLHDLEP